MSTKKKKIALVVGSGSVKCAAALGLWKVLLQAGIETDLFVGCSGGSVFTSAMALDYTLEQTIQNTLQLWDDKITQKRDWGSMLRVLLPGLFGFDENFGMINDGAFLAALDAGFDQLTFADTHKPLFIIATDFLSGEPVVLTQGRIADAIRASSSIPMVWRPYRISDRLLVDGAVSNPMPIDVAIKEGADIILAMGFETPLPRKIKSLSRFAFHLNGIMMTNLFCSKFAFQNLATNAEIITILPTFDQPIGLFDTQQIPHVIAAGEKAMSEQLPYLKRLLQE